MNKITNQFASIEQVTDRYLNRKSTETAAQENSVSFEDILRQKQTTAESQELRFSKHAQGRLNDRHINLSDEQNESCLLYTSPSPRDRQKSRMPSSA